jgi:hypothetical protein
MTQQIINVGTTENDRKGDSLRAAFQKTNANFTELYSDIYTPTSTSDWNGTAPATVGEALDRLAAAVKALNTTGA